MAVQRPSYKQFALLSTTRSAGCFGMERVGDWAAMNLISESRCYETQFTPKWENQLSPKSSKLVNGEQCKPFGGSAVGLFLTPCP